MYKKNLKDVGAVCDDCATAAGFVRKPKEVGVWMGVCEVCGQRKPCTDLWHDWMRNEENETVADIVDDMKDEAFHLDWNESCARICGMLRDWSDRIEAAAKRGEDRWRAALAKVTSVASRQRAKRNLGEQGSRAVAEIMSACRFADGALDEYERVFAENARLRAALKPVLECSLRGCVFAVCNDGKLHHISGLVLDAQRIYNGGEERL